MNKPGDFTRTLKARSSIIIDISILSKGRKEGKEGRKERKEGKID